MKFMIPADRWLEAICRRRSRRMFSDRSVDEDKLQHLQQFCGQISCDCLRISIIHGEADRLFSGIIGSYGKIKNAEACAAFIANTDCEHYMVMAGYVGEAFILEATAMGLSTCWVAGFFRQRLVARRVELSDTDRVIAITPIGYCLAEYSVEERIMAGVFTRRRKRKPLKRLCSGLDEQYWPDWVKQGLEAARLAPSAVNRQPWRFIVGEDFVDIVQDTPRDSYWVSKRIDCGIAMLHFEVGAGVCGVEGKWQYLQHPGVARFTVDV